MDFLQTYPQINKVYQLSNIQNNFEKAYISIREQEGRLHADEIVRQLPYLPKGEKHYQEWRLRQASTRRLLDYLVVEKAQNILDLGCGNGWCTHQLVQNGADVLGLDINQTELAQAARLFTNGNCRFAYGSIFEIDFPKAYFHQIVLNSCVQYFEDCRTLINHLLDLVDTKGAIHILDSPIYQSTEIQAAQARSQAYFENQNELAMKSFYHHHSWEDLKAFNVEIAYNPSHFYQKIKRKYLGGDSPFPWVVIRK